ncbi:MAG: DUF1937 family protein [Selenomonadaceae bacterium]|nr:DUF1937 family protein [Selenomonadaceae bacterium]
MKMIYISHPYSSDEQANKVKAHRLAAELAEAYPGIVFVNPLNAMSHTATANLSYETIVEQCVELMKRCDAVIMVDGWDMSVGCSREFYSALAEGMIIYHGVAEFRHSMDSGGYQYCRRNYWTREENLKARGTRYAPK